MQEDANNPNSPSKTLLNVEGFLSYRQITEYDFLQHYFRINSEEKALKYFDSKPKLATDEESLGNIKIDIVTSTSKSPDDTLKFLVTTQEETFEFIADSEEQRDQWVAAIDFLYKNQPEGKENNQQPRSGSGADMLPKKYKLLSIHQIKPSDDVAIKQIVNADGNEFSIKYKTKNDKSQLISSTEDPLFENVPQLRQESVQNPVFLSMHLKERESDAASAKGKQGRKTSLDNTQTCHICTIY